MTFGQCRRNIYERLAVRMRSFEEVIGEADFVSINCDLNPSTVGIIGGDELGRMKEKVILINTAARGQMIDEAAFVDALRNGGIAGAALDIFEKEPPAVFDYIHRKIIENVIVGLKEEGYGISREVPTAPPSLIHP